MSLPPYEEHPFTYTLPPNPGWKYGNKVSTSEVGRQWLEGEKAGWHVVDTAKEDPRKLYALMISGVVPRPIAFVSTISEDGAENLAPFSWFNTVTTYPPVISVSCMNGPPRVKDTAHNIRATKTFTVNIMSEGFLENANTCSIDAPEDKSEWVLSGLTKEPSILVKPARVKESAFSMECELFQLIDIEHPVTKQKTTSLILGLVKYIHIRKDVLNEKGLVDPGKLKPVSRMGDILYATLGTGIRIPRPDWNEDVAKVYEELESRKNANGEAN